MYGRNYLSKVLLCGVSFGGKKLGDGQEKGKKKATDGRHEVVSRGGWSKHNIIVSYLFFVCFGVCAS